MKISNLVKICSVTDCVKIVRSAGSEYCEMHYYRVRRNGTPHLKPRSYSFNEHVFDELDEDSSWVLGLIWSDGWISCNTIGFVSKDPDLYLGFNEVTEGKGCLRNRSPPCSHCVEWRATSAVAANALRGYGLHEAKSFTIEWPRLLRNELICHFLRGVFDGDGTIGLYKRSDRPGMQRSLSICSASESFSVSMRDEFKKLGIEFIIYRQGNKFNTRCNKISEIQKLRDVFYGCDNCKCLKRKRDKIFEACDYAPRIGAPPGFYSVFGERLTAREIEIKYNLRKGRFNKRVNAGFSPEAATKNSRLKQEDRKGFRQ